jgi:hypothetical protein
MERNKKKSVREERGREGRGRGKISYQKLI